MWERPLDSLVPVESVNEMVEQWSHVTPLKVAERRSGVTPLQGRPSRASPLQGDERWIGATPLQGDESGAKPLHGEAGLPDHTRK